MEQAATLLSIARQSIKHGLQYKQPLKIKVQDYATELQQLGACFVTLKLNGQLRGCIGSLQAQRPLIEDVAQNAFASAFQDPRFGPVSKAEEPELAISISVLTAPELLSFSSEQDLLEQLQPYKDGLILIDAGHKGTFLPIVWESLPDPRQFLQQLKLKAGLPKNHWSNTIQFMRYRTQLIE